MYKLVAMYQQPSDPAAFDRHYTTIHVPMLRTIPGLVRLVVNSGVGMTWGGARPFYLLAELHFHNRVTFDLAMASRQYRAVHKDMQNFARDIVTLVTLW